ncbi:MAG TPA: glycosyltransferase [Candidatus Dormibacteraeota bacterium]|nr:glycosyltransferase [Candidatus Dormibacteraeota bacterium]
MPAPLLSVIVPAYREGPRIHANLLHLLGDLDRAGFEYEVLVISDGNTDDTVAEAERVGSDRVRVLAYRVNEGKGFAVMHGVRAARGELIAYIDADMEILPDSIASCVRAQREGGWDIIVGSKRHRDSQVSYPWFRRFQSWIYQVIIAILFQLDVSDTQTGLKLFRGEVLRSAVPLLAVKRFAFDLELLVVARKLGYRRILEIPVRISYKFETTTGLAAVYNTLWDTAAIFYRLRFLHYYDRRRRASAHSPARRKDDVQELTDQDAS